MKLKSSVRMDKAVENRAREVPEPKYISGFLVEEPDCCVFHAHIPVIAGLLTI
jgi:hypothetical protein